jgi:hypothetical protein
MRVEVSLDALLRRCGHEVQTATLFAGGEASDAYRLVVAVVLGMQYRFSITSG